MTDEDRNKVGAIWRQADCERLGPSGHPVCASSPEQLCVGSCGGGGQDMSRWLTDAFGPERAEARAERRVALRAGHREHQRCARRCASEGVAVDASDGNASQLALEVLRRCGVVQLPGAYDLGLLGRVQSAIDKLSADQKRYGKLLDRTQLHDGRYQVYLPYAAPFKSREALGAGDLVLSVLAGYFAGSGFGIDHVSILTSASGSDNQSLHPDVPYFRNLAVSVHTALRDITLGMGPTFFCPCTGEALQRDQWPMSAAIKMSVLKRQDCMGPSLVPLLTKRGTVTIYDGATFHKGLANGSDRDRPVLKLEVGAEGFPARRNYEQLAPAAAKRHTELFRGALGPPRFGEIVTRATG